MGKENIKVVETAEEEFAQILERAKQGDNEAEFLVGVAYDNGEGV